MPEDNPNSITTTELLRQLHEINVRLDLQQETRHKANSDLQKTIVKFGHEAIVAGDRIENLQSVVKSAVESLAPFAEIKDDAKQIKRVLFGDEKMREKGLVQRFDEVDTVVKKSLIEQRVFFTILGAIVTIVGFIKGSGVIKWLIGP
jgi:negative regulator of replication initiation